MKKDTRAYFKMDADKVTSDKIGADNKKVKEFAHVAFISGMTYGQLQQKETIAILKGEGKEFKQWLQKNINS